MQQEAKDARWSAILTPEFGEAQYALYLNDEALMGFDREQAEGHLAAELARVSHIIDAVENDPDHRRQLRRKLVYQPMVNEIRFEWIQVEWVDQPRPQPQPHQELNDRQRELIAQHR